MKRLLRFVFLTAGVSLAWHVWRSREFDGAWLGIPYDLRRPSLSRVQERWWNADDTRLLTPHVFGWGYSLNLRRALTLVRGRCSGHPGDGDATRPIAA